MSWIKKGYYAINKQLPGIKIAILTVQGKQKYSVFLHGRWQSTHNDPQEAKDKAEELINGQP